MQRSTRTFALSVAVGLAVAFGLGAGLSHAPRAAAAAGTVLFAPTLPQNAGYPRAIRLSHSGSANGTLLATFALGGDGTPRRFPVYRSADDGRTWTGPIGTVRDTQHGWSLGAPTLFELPSTAGDLPAGTLLSAGQAWVEGDYRQQALEVFASTDHGVTWRYRSSCASESGQPDSKGHGLWEPSFAVAADGSLVCYFSDERSAGSGYRQLIGHVVSHDGGATWGTEVRDVAVADNVARPGMPVVTRLPDGRYLMAFEYCKAGYAPDTACAVYVKSSADGLSWTPVSGLGTRVQTSDGRHLQHTPYVAWAPGGGPNGTVIVSGQQVVTGADGATTEVPESGGTVMTSTNLGAGSWSELTAPVTVRPTGGGGPDKQRCPGYSSSILPTADGNGLLYLAATQLTGAYCEIRFGRSGVGALPYADDFASGRDDGWTTYGGTWSVAGGVYSDISSGAGHKSLTGSTGWGNYTVSANVRLDAVGQAGLSVRATAPGVGADALRGYYAGISAKTGRLILGRQDNGYVELAGQAVAGGVAVGVWYYLSAQAYGCTLTLSVTEAGSATDLATVSTTDADCFPTGQAGVRTHFTPSSFRNLTVVS
jgi:hypothetical protein